MPDPLQFTSADGETYEIVLDADSEGHAELRVLSYGEPRYEHASVLFFPDELGDVAALFTRAAEAAAK